MPLELPDSVAVSLFVSLAVVSEVSVLAAPVVDFLEAGVWVADADFVALLLEEAATDALADGFELTVGDGEIVMLGKGLTLALTVGLAAGLKDALGLAEILAVGETLAMGAALALVDAPNPVEVPVETPVVPEPTPTFMSAPKRGAGTP